MQIPYRLSVHRGPELLGRSRNERGREFDRRGVRLCHKNNYVLNVTKRDPRYDIREKKVSNTGYLVHILSFFL